MNAYIKAISPALAFLFIAMILQIAWLILDLPSKNDLLKLAQGFFQEYGLIVFFIIAILEGLLLIGWYFPGGTVLFVGVVLAGNDLELVIANGLIISLGLIFAYIINYWLGFYGWHKLFTKFGLAKSLIKVQEKLKQNTWSIFFLTYWHPSTAALASTATGLLKLDFFKFFINSLISLLIWNFFWGLLIYYLGEKAMGIASFKFVFVVILLWIFSRLLYTYKHSKI